MNTATRLGAYGAGLALVFAGAFVAADAVVPRARSATGPRKREGHDMGSTTGGHGGHGSSAMIQASAAVPGVTSAQAGYVLTPVTAPDKINENGACRSASSTRTVTRSRTTPPRTTRTCT